MGIKQMGFKFLPLYSDHSTRFTTSPKKLFTSYILLIKPILYCLAATVLCFATANANESVVLQLKWKHQFQFAGFYTALEKGYYEEAGLDVFIKEGMPGVKASEELLAGRADFSVDSPSVLIERNKGKSIVALAAIFQHSAEILVALKSSGLSSVHDLIGKKILMRPMVDAEIMAMFKNEGISNDQINIIEHTWNPDDLIKGKVDLYGGYITDVPFLLQEKGLPYTIISPLTYGIDFYGDCLFTRQALIDQKPAQVKAFLEASLKGWSYAMTHQEEIVDLIYEKYSDRLSRKALMFEASAMHKLMQPKFIEIGHMNPGRWAHIADTFVKLGMLEPPYSLEGFLYSPDIPSYNRNLVRLTYVVTALFLFFSFVAMILYGFNKGLRKKVDERTTHLIAEIETREQVQKRLENELNDRKKAEKEKEVMLQEIHHRVKNNLQMVESLLNLQLSEITEKSTLAPLEDSKNRVRSMALVHETLYRTGNFSHIDIKSYTEDLISPLLASMKPANTLINITYDIDSVLFDIDTTIACGLIINELVNNALQHGFHERNIGNIFISIKRIKGSRVRIQVADDGVGMPPGIYNSDQGTLGLQIVRLMAEKQLEADVEVEGSNGVVFTFSFSLINSETDDFRPQEKSADC